MLSRLGAKSIDGRVPWPCFEIETKVGKLTGSIHTGLWCLNEGVTPVDDAPWIATRFKNPKAAVTLVDCNQFSGKWNFHCWRNWTGNFAYGLAVVESLMKRVL